MSWHIDLAGLVIRAGVQVRDTAIALVAHIDLAHVADVGRRLAQGLLGL